MTRLKRLLSGVGLVLALAAPVAGQGALAPIGIQQHDANGDPCSGCVLVSFAAGTSTPLATFADSALATSNGTSLTLDSAGRAPCFLDSRLAYKLTLRTSTGTDIWTRDGIVGQLSSVVSVTANENNALRVSRAGGTAGISVASTGGSGQSFELQSNQSGVFTIGQAGVGWSEMQWTGTNITAGLTGTFTISGGLLSVTGAGDHLFSAGTSGLNRLGIRNTNIGEGAAASLLLGNDSASNAGALSALSSGYTTAGAYVADGVSLEATRAGGLSINASHASGSIRFYAGGATTPQLTISSTGGISVGSFTGSVASPGAGTTNDYAIGNASVITYNSGISGADVTGITGGASGRMIWVFTSPGSAGSLTLFHESASSTAANRITSATGANITVTSLKAVQLIYDTGTSRWLAFDVK